MAATLIRRSLALVEPEVTTTAGRYTVLEGRAVPYWQWSDVGYYLEQWATHALNESTVHGTRSLPLLLFHDNRERFPIGHSLSWRSATDGLHGAWALNDSADAQTAAGMVNSGDLSGLSIGFQAEEQSWQYAKNFDPHAGPSGLDRVTRTKARLLEVSIVSTPAFADAQVASVRSAQLSPKSVTRPRNLGGLDPAFLTMPGATTAMWRAHLAVLKGTGDRPNRRLRQAEPQSLPTPLPIATPTTVDERITELEATVEAHGVRITTLEGLGGNYPIVPMTPDAPGGEPAPLGTLPAL
jgi:HK97 family phage prohead protease